MSQDERKTKIKNFIKNQDVLCVEDDYIKFYVIKYLDDREDTLSPASLERLMESYYDIDDIDFSVIYWIIDDDKMVDDIIIESNKLYKKYFEKNID